MSSGKYDLPYNLRLRPSFCLYQYLFLVHVVALELLAGLDIEIGLSLLLIALLVRHYQQIWSHMPCRRYTELSYRSEQGWELLNDEVEPVRVSITRVHRFTARWLMIHLNPVPDTRKSVVLVLCPDVLRIEEARSLKRYLLLHQHQTVDAFSGIQQ
jgi:hypothetical protein